MHSLTAHVSYDSQLLNLTVYHPIDHTYHLEQIFKKNLVTNFQWSFSPPNILRYKDTDGF